MEQPPHDLTARIAVVEAAIAGVQDEMRRTRDRLHDVENDRHAVRLLALKLDGLSEDVGELGAKVDTYSQGMDAVAQRAAREVFHMGIEEWEKGRNESKLRQWGNYIAFAVALLALVSFLLQAWVAARGGRP